MPPYETPTGNSNLFEDGRNSTSKADGEISAAVVELLKSVAYTHLHEIWVANGQALVLLENRAERPSPVSSPPFFAVSIDLAKKEVGPLLWSGYSFAQVCIVQFEKQTSREILYKSTFAGYIETTNLGSFYFSNGKWKARNWESNDIPGAQVSLDSTDAIDSTRELEQGYAVLDIDGDLTADVIAWSRSRTKPRKSWIDEFIVYSVKNGKEVKTELHGSRLLGAKRKVCSSNLLFSGGSITEFCNALVVQRKPK